MNKQEMLDNINKRIERCWAMTQVFVDNRDAHGVMDMGAELQSLQRSKGDLERINAI